MSLEQFQQAYLPRHSVYALNEDVPISDDKVVDIVRFYVEHTPSSFNSQTTRAIVAIGKEHKKIWNDIAYNALKEKLASKPEVFEEQTAPKLAAFAAGHITVLYFVDDNKVNELKAGFPSYADRFEQWADHSIGAAQINTWSALALENVGANLQHYNPLIDAAIEKEFNVPKGWRLVAQLVVGGIAQPAPVPEHLDPKETVLVAK